jgi:protein phosphatase
MILLCSDGLHGPVADEKVAGILTGARPHDAAKQLVDAANAAGGPDNVTVVLVAARS